MIPGHDSENAISLLRALSSTGQAGPIMLLDCAVADEIRILFASRDAGTAFGIAGLRNELLPRRLSVLDSGGLVIRAIRSLPEAHGNDEDTTVDKQLREFRKQILLTRLPDSPHLILASRKRHLLPADIRFRRMAEVLEAAPSLAAFVDRDLKFVYVNRKYCAFLGMTKSAIHGMSIFDLPGGEFDRAGEHLQSVLGGMPLSFEISSLNPDGVRIPIELNLRPDFVEDHDSGIRSVDGFFIHGKDLTLLRANEMRLRVILDNIGAEVVFLSSDFQIRYANRNFARLLNTVPRRLTGNNIVSMVTSRGWTGLEPHLIRAVSGELFKVEHSFPSAEDGSQRVGLFHFVPEFFESPESRVEKTVTGIFLLIIDISEIKRIQDELNRTKTRFELAVDSSTIGIWEGDVNNADWIDTIYIEKMLGLEPGDLKNSRRQVRARIHPDDIEVNDHARGLHESGLSSPNAELRIKTSSSEYKWFTIAGKSQRNEDGEIVRLAGTIADIDRLKKAEIAAAEQLKRRDELLAMLSHELRNPVTAIAYSADLLKDCSRRLDPNSPGVDELLPAAEIISRQSLQMSRLIDDLLNVARITRNRIDYDFQVHDFNFDVQSVVESMKQVFEQRDQQLITDWHAGPMIVYADTMRLKQALANLLDNAAKYTPPGREIKVSTHVEGSQAEFKVQDSGQGIPPEISEQIFELFFQQPQSIERKSGGLGVGLFIVKNIIDSHRGSVTAFSEGVGKGSCFEVRLPLFNAPDAQPKPASMGRLFDGQRLMLVEDNDDSRSMLAKILEIHGLEVVQFSNGESAAEQVETLRPLVALIDIGLPGKNGYELAQEIRSIKSLEGILLIALTGYGLEEDRAAAVDAGFDRHLTKPTDSARLCEYIASIICD